MPAQIPTEELRQQINDRLMSLSAEIIQHPQFKPDLSSTLYQLLDFVKRSGYMLSEYDNIKAGRPAQHPEQLRGQTGTGQQAALKIFNEVCASSLMIEMMVSGAPPVGTQRIDYGQPIKDAVKALKDVCPEASVMAGMMG